METFNALDRFQVDTAQEAIKLMQKANFLLLNIKNSSQAKYNYGDNTYKIAVDGLVSETTDSHIGYVFSAIDSNNETINWINKALGVQITI